MSFAHSPLRYVNLFLNRNFRIQRNAQSLPTREKLHSRIDLLLHPRHPPIVRTLPFVESLSLSSAEETVEETTTRQSLNLAFGNEEIPLVTSGPQIHPEPVIQNSLTVSQLTLPDPSQERAVPTPVGLHLQNKRDTSNNLPMEAPTSSITPAVPPSQTVSDRPAESSLPVSQKGPAPGLYLAPMLVDESDHEELPTIDLGSDSDT